MKTNFTSAKKIHATLLAALLLGAGASPSQAAIPFPPSPVFTNGVPAWDCLITGAHGERGIMFLTFFTNKFDSYGNYSFTMRQIHTKVPASSVKVPVTITNTPDSGGRGGSASGRGGDTGSGGLINLNNGTIPGAGTNISGAGTNIYGYLELNGTNGVGSWGYDYKGNILGFYVELVIDTVTDTNITYITNQVSFIGKVTPNKRFTALYSSTVGGNGKYAGLPLKPVTLNVNGHVGQDLSGPWTGDEIIGPVDMVELFTMTNSGFTNSYNIVGDGPGYSLNFTNSIPPKFSKCLVSSQKKIAFSNHKYTNPTNSAANTQRATFGPLSNSTIVAGGKTKGLIDPGSNVVYNAFFVPFSPYP